MIRRATGFLALILMAAFGFGVYTYLGTLKSKMIAPLPRIPATTKSNLSLPGTMYLVQAGSLYRLKAGTFTQVGPPGGWSQPALAPDHNSLVAVRRVGQSSDLYLLDLDGQVLRRLTRNESRVIDFNHWAYYPRLSPDGQTLYYSYDAPKLDYRVDFAIWAMPMDGGQTRAQRLTSPFYYSGGDVSPIPLRSGGLLYVKYDIDDRGSSSRIWLRSKAGTAAKPLTNEADNCSQPALSPDETQLVMLCTPGSGTPRLMLAPFSGDVLGPAQLLVDRPLCAAPAWAPDASGIVYLAPARAGGEFQLWWQPIVQPSPPGSPGPTPKPPLNVPHQLSSSLDFEATSPPAWF